MDIKITDSALRKFLETPADPETLAADVSLCGPTFDRIHKTETDYLYEIEAITNRVDTASALGVAREAAIILSQFDIPAKLINDPNKDQLISFPKLHRQFNLEIDKENVIRYTAISIESVRVGESPDSVKKMLENCGQRPINNLVDITNELTILYGMPCHVFDLDKLAAQKLTIRLSTKNEELKTLDGIKNKLNGGDIVMEDGSNRLVDLCGVMGGQIAEVDNHTTNILFIVPVYDPKKIRKTSLYLQKRTLAAQIYEKQPDPELTLPLLNKAVQLIKDRAKGEISSSLFDYYPSPRKTKFVELNFEWLNSFVGTRIEKDKVISILDGLGFSGTVNNDSIICNIPSWRYHDINLKEDLAEEVARVNGYFRLPAILPCVNMSPEQPNIILKTENSIKPVLPGIGYHEVYNSSLIPENLITVSGLNISDHIHLQNALSSDFEYLRTSLVPSLLMNLKHNTGKIEGAIKLFEVSNVYIKNKNILPEEISNLAILSTDGFREAKGDLENLLNKVKITGLQFMPSQTHPDYFDSNACASINSEDKIIGYIGLIKQSILRNIGIAQNPVISEINIKLLSKHLQTSPKYTPVSEYPNFYEDITVSSSKNIGDLINTIKNTSSLIKEVVFLGSYDHNHSFKITFSSLEKNLEQTDINPIKETILERLKK